MKNLNEITTTKYKLYKSVFMWKYNAILFALVQFSG